MKEIKEKINLEIYDNSNVNETFATNYEELFTEVQNELIHKLTIQNQILINLLENNDLESAKHWAENISKTTKNIVAKHSKFQENQYTNKLNYLIINFENNEINFEPHYFYDLNEWNKAYELSYSKNYNNHWSYFKDNFSKIDDDILVNLIDEIHKFHHKISNPKLLETQITNDLDSCKNDGFLKLNNNSILLINPIIDPNYTGSYIFGFTNSDIEWLEKNKEYLNEIKTKFFNISKEREM